MRTGASQWLVEQRVDMAALLAKEGDFSSLLGMAEMLYQAGHWWVDLPDQTIKWSGEVYHIHGLTPDLYTPELESAIGFYHPDDRDLVAAALHAAAENGTPFSFSLRLIRSDGQLRYVKARGFAIVGPDQVPARIFGVFIDMTEERNAEVALRAENDKLQQIAYIDALTSLANRRQFDDALASEWLRAIREETPLSLVMLDVDRFKLFNDLYGHSAGDECLRVVARTVKAILRRPGDLVARYGGEEFALLLPGTIETGALKLAHEVQTAITALQLSHIGNADCGGVVTASLGVATAYPQPGSWPGDWIDLINKADELLYTAKRAGRNRVASAVDVT
jgi:diguanylate cyclase (GGDEF)-like protein